jgi:hypothetical protein
MNTQQVLKMRSRTEARFTSALDWTVSTNGCLLFHECATISRTPTPPNKRHWDNVSYAHNKFRRSRYAILGGT